MKKNRLSFWIVGVSIALLTGCVSSGTSIPDSSLSYVTNDEDYVDENTNWLTSTDWGSSHDGLMVMVGEYSHTSDSVTLIDEKAAPGTFDQAFYHAGGIKSDFLLSGEFNINSMTMAEGVFNKMGFYVPYKDPENYIHVVLHPLESEHFVSVSAKVAGAWVRVWQVFDIPQDTNFSLGVTFSIYKVSSEFRMYLDDSYIGSFTAEIDAGEVGVLSEKTLYTVNNFAFEDIDSFPSVTEGWGDSSDGEIPAAGSYDIAGTSAAIMGTAATSSIFTEAEYDDYVIRSRFDFDPINQESYHRAGYYLTYEDIDNHDRLWYDYLDDKIVFEEYLLGVKTTTEISDVVILSSTLIEIYKIGSEIKVYLDDNLLAEFNTGLSQGQIGLLSENVTGAYTSFAINEAATFPVSTWGNSFDGILPRRGTHSIVNDTVTFTTTAEGSYGSMEQIFYNGSEPQVNFTVAAKIHHEDPVVDANNKYGFTLYAGPGNYLELYIIPELNGVYAVSQINGSFDLLWANLGSFPEAYDHRNPEASRFEVVREGASVTLNVGESQLWTSEISAYADMPMQVGLISEKTAPVIFAEFSFESQIVLGDNWGTTFDEVLPVVGTPELTESGVVFASTAEGGYGSMEQLFYRGTSALVGFSASASMHHEDPSIDGNNKYGFLLYGDASNYIEFYIIPALNGVYAVSKVAGTFGLLWTLLGSFPAEYDFSSAEALPMTVIKNGATFSLQLGVTELWTGTINQFAEMPMQVGLISEKTAPVYFDNIIIG